MKLYCKLFRTVVVNKKRQSFDVVGYTFDIEQSSMTELQLKKEFPNFSDLLSVKPFPGTTVDGTRIEEKTKR